MIGIERIRKMRKKTNWFWNVIIVFTLIGCTLAFVLHYKNWTSIKEGYLMITSGIYRQQIPLNTINTLEFVPKLPEMQRKNGFSWLAKEKGLFLDSISGQEVYVFVDDLRQRKLHIVHNDSLELYVNLADSLETQNLFDQLNMEGTSSYE